MRLRFWAVILFVVLASIPVAASYTENDLWIVEIIINEDIASSQVTDALILGEQVYLPLTKVASILKIPLNINHDRGTYTFTRPGNLVTVLVDTGNLTIEVVGQERRTYQDMHMINGELYLNIQMLGELMDAELNYVTQHLVVYLNTAHLEMRKDDRTPTKAAAQADEEERPAFSISNITYRWNIDWEKSCQQLTVVGANPDDDEGRDEEENAEAEEVTEPTTTVTQTEEEDYESTLRLDMKGTVYDWKYWLQGQVHKEMGNPITTEFSKYLLTYDMDRAQFSIGKLTAVSENELNLKKSAFDGVQLVSKVSPLYRMNGNLVQIVGEAPEKSKVMLFINSWPAGTLEVKADGTYCFSDVLLTYSGKVNELKVTIKKPGGDIVNIYRYISVSDAILNKGEVDYLVQAGNLKTGDCTGNYLWNSIVYWGATEQTTFGLSSYGEMQHDAASIEELIDYSYTSLRLNQRFNDNWVAKAAVYNVNSSANGTPQNDLGYKVNVDYQDALHHLGFEYHREGKTFKDKDEFPYETYHLFLVRNLDLKSLILGKVDYYKSITNPTDRQQHYEVGYKTGGDTWDGSVTVMRDYYEQKNDSWQNSLQASLAYFIRPNLKLIHDVEYQTKWKELLTKEMSLGLGGVYEVAENTFVAGIDWNANLTANRTSTNYSLSWSKRWELGQNQHITGEAGYEIKFAGEEQSHILPLGFRYNYILPNDARIQLYYEGQWEKSEKSNEVTHKVGLSLEGAFNFFGGKLTSTSPHGSGNQVGVVTGVVFRDVNRNGQFDEGELPLAGIPVRLGRKIQFTDTEGKFYFKQIPHGVHYLGFDYTQLPIELTASTADKNVKVIANGEVKEYLGLYTVGAVDGQIRVKNKPADLPTEKLTFRGITIVVAPGGYTVMADSTGYYYFDQLPPGQYQLTIDSAKLPEWAAKEEITPQSVEITDAGEYVSNIDFTLSIDQEWLKAHTPQADAVEVVPVEPAPQPKPAEPAKPEPAPEPAPEVEPTVPAVPETIEGLEDKLIDVTDNVLQVDLAKKTAVINGEEVIIDPFFIQDEQVWAPIRKIAQIFDCRVFWDPKEQRIYIVDNGKNILMDVRLGYVMVNGVKQELHDGFMVKDNYTFVTLDDLAVIGLEFKVQGDILYIYRDNL